MNAFLNRKGNMKPISKVTPMELKPLKDNMRMTRNSHPLSVPSNSPSPAYKIIIPLL